MNRGALMKERRRALGLTLEEVARRMNTSKQTIQRYESGAIANIPREKIAALSAILELSPSALMGWEATQRRLPLLGQIACGVPVFADETRGESVAAPDGVEADFCLTAKGDSMIGARIFEGDLVFIRAQDTVENGEIAAVIIDDEATLKRLYYHKEGERLILSAENPAYPPLVFSGEELSRVKILGRAVAFQSVLV